MKTDDEVGGGRRGNESPSDQLEGEKSRCTGSDDALTRAETNAPGASEGNDHKSRPKGTENVSEIRNEGIRKIHLGWFETSRASRKMKCVYQAIPRVTQRG